MWSERHNAKDFASLGMFLCLAVGCAKKEPTPSPEQTAAATALKPLSPPTDEACKRFADKLDQLIKTRNVMGATNLIDWTALLDRAFERLVPGASLRREFDTAFKTGIVTSGGPMREVTDAVAQGASYRFLGVHRVGEERRVLFRLLLPGEAALDYHDFIMNQSEDGTVVAVDLEVYTVGELYSQTVRRTAIPLVDEQQRDLRSRLTRAERDFLRYSAEFAKLSELVNDEQHEQALDAYDKLPASLQKDKITLLLRLKAAQQVSRRAFDAALRAAREQFAGDAAVNLQLIDNFVMRREYENLRAAIGCVEKAIGFDPYLEVLRANSYIEEDRLADARACLERALAAEPDLQPAKNSLRLIDATERPAFDNPLPEQKNLKALCVLARDGKERWVKMPGHYELGSASTSSDGQWIAFDALTAGLNPRRECWLVNVDGTGLRKLADGATPRWSPDGEQLLLMRDDRPEESWVFRIDRDGKNEKKICLGRWPDWSPDGEQIAFSRGGGAGRFAGAYVGAKIYVARFNGSDPQYVTDGDCPCFSPDSLRIAYCRELPDAPAPKLFVIDLETKKRHELRFGWYRASWSGDGKSLVSNGIGPDDRRTPLRITLGQADVDYFLRGYVNPFSPTVSRDGSLTVFLADRPGREPPAKEAAPSKAK